MWDLPRPGLEPVSPALAGRFSTTAPPGKPFSPFLILEKKLTLCQTLLSPFTYIILFNLQITLRIIVIPFLNIEEQRHKGTCQGDIVSEQERALALCSCSFCSPSRCLWSCHCPLPTPKAVLLPLPHSCQQCFSFLSHERLSWLMRTVGVEV